MFDAEHPAPDIHILIAYLRGEHREGDLYRGQETAYPSLIPSGYRRAIATGARLDEPIVRIDPQLFLSRIQSDRRESLRYVLLERLVRDAGIGLGNLIAQQYGITSECVDVTEEIDVAAYFATRRWPEYSHVTSAATGVLYRFRRTPSDLVPPDASRQTLNCWFEMGQSEGVFFDFFVRQGELEKVFERDRWIDWSSGRQATVSTLPLALRWANVIDAIRREAVSLGPEPAEYRPDWLTRHLLSLDWRRSRASRQRGGFLRPAFVWEASVPQRFDLRHASEPRPKRGGVISPSFGPHDDGLPWPRAVPSAALKQRLIGVENLLRRAGCQAFFFHHSEARVALYRRDLWPEPSEDPLYQIVWHQAILQLMRRYADAESMPAVDDPDHGLLDRGYRVAGERHTRDARELDDLMRGQLQDAQEALASGGSAADAVRLSGALAFQGRSAHALRAALGGLRAAPDSKAALLSVAALLNRRGKPLWAERLARRALAVAPGDADALEALGTLAQERGDLQTAASLLDAALASFDAAIHQGPEYELVAKRAIVAGLLDDRPTLEEMLRRYRLLGFDPGPLSQHISELRSTAH